jgi:hypothetical protein
MTIIIVTVIVTVVFIATMIVVVVVVVVVVDVVDHGHVFESFFEVLQAFVVQRTDGL